MRSAAVGMVAGQNRRCSSNHRVHLYDRKPAHRFAKAGPYLSEPPGFCGSKAVVEPLAKIISRYNATLSNRFTIH